MQTRIYKYLLLGILIIATYSCKSKREYFEKDVEDVQIEILRFDSALLSLPPDSTEISAKIGQLFTDFPVFMPVFSEEILGIPVENIDILCGILPQFLEDTAYGFKETNALEQRMFADISDIQKDVNSAFGKIHYLYPDWYIPKVYLFVSGFMGSVTFVEDDIAIGADRYLGSDYKYYSGVVYEYEKLMMRKECVAGDIVSAYLFRNIEYTSKENRLLDNMIFRGKIMYLLTQLLPETKPWEVFGYTKESWEWIEEKEASIWRLMLDKQDLYKTETVILSSYLNNGPFCSEISQDCPARIGTWIGMRIVESYMESNPEISLQELMIEGDAQHILTKSNYRP